MPEGRSRRARRLRRGEFASDAASLAVALLGKRLVRVLGDGTRLSGEIVETEAYLGVEDLAAHSAGGRRTARNEAMYGRPGTAYVYFTYGMHHCFNVVCGAEGEPAAVLVRALAPVEGVGVMRENRLRARPRGARSALRDVDLCSGPARLCAAMGIDLSFNGLDLVRGGGLFVECAGWSPGAGEVLNTARVGVGYAGRWAVAPLRWCVAGSPHVSRVGGAAPAGGG